MRQGWEIKSLNELCEFSNGLWTGKKPPFIKAGVIRNTNFTKDGKLDDSDIVYLDVEVSQFEKRKLQYGDLILEKSGGGPKQPVGRVVIFDKKDGGYSFSNFTSSIRIKVNSKLDFNYLHKVLHFMYMNGATENMQSHSTGIRNLKFDDYKQIQVPIPPLPEQQRIVSILDKTFAAIDKAKANLQQNLLNAKELFESYLQNVFAQKGEGWEEKRLGDLVVDVQYGSSAKSKSKGKVPVLRMGNIQNRKFVWDDLVYTDDVDEIKKYELKHNDVLFNRTNSPELVGKTAIYKGETPAIFAGYLIRINRKKDLLDADFLNYFLNSTVVREYGFSVMTSSINQANINGSKLKEYPIVIPSLQKQKEIVVKLDMLLRMKNEVEDVYQQKLSSLDELKKSILQKAFSGELAEPISGELTAAPKLYATEEAALSLAAEPEAAYPKPALTKQQAFLHKLMLASHIVYELCEEKKFGHTKLMKLLYLCEQAGGMALQTNYKKFAAGPFDGKTLTLIDKEFEKNKWFEIIKTKFTIGGKEREATSYKRTEKSLLYKKHFDNYFANKAVTINRVIELFRKEVTDTVEIVATLFYVWKEFLANGSDVVINKLVTGFYKFHPDKKKFKPQQIEEGYQFMLNNSVFPVT
jgi:type I restriction enzyme, S subunit